MSRVRQGVVLIALIALVAAFAGCATRGPIDDADATAKLGFLQPGGPTRAEVEARLGPPDHVYEGGRVATYTVSESEGRLTTTFVQYGDSYTLVIEYAPDGTVARRSLVRRVK